MPGSDLADLPITTILTTPTRIRFDAPKFIERAVSRNKCPPFTPFSPKRSGIRRAAAKLLPKFVSTDTSVSSWLTEGLGALTLAEPVLNEHYNTTDVENPTEQATAQDVAPADVLALNSSTLK